MSGYWKNLESRSWVGGGSVPFAMNGLPPLWRIRSVIMNFVITGTKGGSETCTSDLLHTLVQNIKLANFVNISGLELFRMRHMQNGRIVEDPTAIPGSGTTWTATFQLEIMFRQTKQAGTDDGSLPTELVMGKNLEIQFAAANILGGTIVATAGTVRVGVELIHETNVPQLIRYGYLDYTSQTVKGDAGIYGEVFLCRADGSTIATTDISRVDLSSDGVPILQNVTYEQLLTAWNRQAATAGGTRAELQNGAALFLPISWLDKYGKSNLTKQMACEKDFVLQLTGSLSAFRLVFQKTVLKSDSDILQAAVITGAPQNAVMYEPATASKTPLHAKEPGQKPSRKVRLAGGALPGKARTRTTPGTV